MKGTVKFFNNMKGFGFIAGTDGKEYFVHQTGLKPGVTLNENDVVEFDGEQGDKGPKAVNVGKGTADSESEDSGSQEEASSESEDSSSESEDSASEPEDSASEEEKQE